MGNKKSHIMRWLILTGILLFGAFLRLYRIGDYITFLGDEGRDVLVAYNILHGHLTLLGPTSSVGGFFLGPIYYYFMAPFLWLFNYNPVGPAVMVALLGIVTIWFVYKIGKEFFNTYVGLTAAALYAISPLVITYSRSSWNPNLMPLFTLLTIYTLYKALEQNKKKLFIMAGFLFGITMQLHYLATFLIPVIVLYVAVSNIYDYQHRLVTFAEAVRRKMLVYLLFSGGFLLGFSPFLAFEIRHGFRNITNIFLFVFHSKDTGAGSNFFITIGTVFFRLFGRLLAGFPPPEQYAWYNSSLLIVWGVVTVILALVSVSIFLLCIKHTYNNRQKFLQYILLTLFFFSTIFLFGLYKKTIYDYYFELLFPLPFLFVANFIVWLWSKNKVLRIVASVLFLFLVGINLQGIPFRYTPNKQLQQTENISRFVMDKTQGKPFNFALITGGNSDHAYRYFFTIWGNPPKTIQIVPVDPTRMTVTKQLFIVCESLPCFPLGNPEYEIAGFGRAEIAGHWPISVVEVYKLVHYTGK